MHTDTLTTALINSTTRDDFIAASVALAKAEMLTVWADGGTWYENGPVMPLNVTSFSQLHDYVDANEIGGLCDDGVNATADRLFGATSTDNEAQEISQEWADVCNTIQNTVGAWLAATVDARIVAADSLADARSEYCAAIDAIESARGTASEGDAMGTLNRTESARDAALDFFMAL